MLCSAAALRAPSLVLLGLLCLSCDTLASDEDWSVVAYTGPEISQGDVAVGWSGRTTNDKVILTSPTALDEPRKTFIFTLNDRGDALPSVDDVWYGEVDGLGQTLRKGRVEIQAWSPTEVVSGAFEVKLVTGRLVYAPFWVDLSATP